MIELLIYIHFDILVELIYQLFINIERVMSLKKYSVLLFLVLANLFWAGNYVFGQYLVVEMSPLQMTFFDG